jgi:hypothetical protein
MTIKKTTVLMASVLAAILMLAFASISSNNTVPVVEAASPILWCYDAQILDDPFPVCFNHGKGECKKAQQEDIDARTECRKVRPVS